MKIRTDFVTNSSSSSFIAYKLESKKLTDFIRKLVNDGKTTNKSENQFYDDDYDFILCGSIGYGKEIAVIDEEHTSIVLDEGFMPCEYNPDDMESVINAVSCCFDMNEEESKNLNEIIREGIFFGYETRVCDRCEYSELVECNPDMKQLKAD